MNFDDLELDLGDDDPADELDNELADDKPTTDDALAEYVEQAVSKDTDSKRIYETVYAFVENQLAPIIQRKINTGAGKGLAFDPQWWRYPEVEARFTALWYAWEAAYKGDAWAMSTWWIHHCDPQLDRILDAERGAFHKYNMAAPFNEVPPGLPVEPYTPE